LEDKPVVEQGHILRYVSVYTFPNFVLIIAQRYTTDTGLPNHTIFSPQNVNAVNGTLPVVVWGNGGCSANGLSQQNFLAEIASWGFIVIASGGPNQQGSTTAAMMKASIDFASMATSGVFAKVNKDAIAAAGFSCGGIEAYEQAQDARVKALGIFNSGQMSEEGTRKVVPSINGKPVFFFLGGPSDIAYNNVRLLGQVPATT
jgi:hypothetical protein